MHKRFLKDLGFLVGLNLLIKPLYLFVFEAGIQNEVGSQVFGDYFSLLSFAMLLQILLDFGLNNYNTVSTAATPGHVEKYFGKLMALRIILLVLYLVILTGAGMMLDYNRWELNILLWVGFNQFLAGMVLFFRSNLQGLHRFRRDAWLSVIDRILLVAMCGMLLFSSWFESPLDIRWFIGAQTLAYGVSAFSGFLMTGPAKLMQGMGFHWLTWWTLLRRSFPYALLILIMAIYYRSDAVMLERLLADGDTQAGIYAQGYRIMEAINMFAWMFTSLLLPMFARMVARKLSVASLVHTSSSLLIGAAALMSGILLGNAEAILSWVYEHDLDESTKVFKWLMPALVPIFATYVMGTLLTAGGKLRVLNWISIIALTVNIVLNFILIPEYKAQGAAIATVATQSVAAIAQWVLARRTYMPEGGEFPYARFIVFALLFGAALWLTNSYLQIAAIYLILLQGVIGVGLLVAVGVWQWRMGLELMQLRGGEDNAE